MPTLQEQVDKQEEQIKKLTARVNEFMLSDKYHINRNIEIGTPGTRIGTSTAQKLAFFNATPVNQPDTISDPTGGGTIDTQARSAVNALIDRLQELGLIA